jgi:hypothetical protein
MASATTYIDGDFTSAQEVGAPRYTYPFRTYGDRASAYFEQDYWQLIANWTPLEMATAHPTLQKFYLMGESPPQRVAPTIYQFTRTWAMVPVSNTAYSTTSVNRPLPSSVGTAVNAQKVTGSGASANLGANYTFGDGLWINNPLAASYATVYNVVYYPSVTVTSAANSGNCRVTWTGHALAGTEKIAIYLTNGGTSAHYLFGSGDYSVIDSNTIDLTGWSAYTASTARKYLRSYTPGLADISSQVAMSFYLPGVTPGISSASDITIPSAISTDSAFLLAVLANTSGYVTYRVNGLDYWLDGYILRLQTLKLNFASL